MEEKGLGVPAENLADRDAGGGGAGDLEVGDGAEAAGQAPIVRYGGRSVPGAQGRDEALAAPQGWR